MNLWKKIMLGAATTFAVAAFSLGVASNPATASADMVKAASGNATNTKDIATVEVGSKLLMIHENLGVSTVKVYFPTAKDTKDGLVNLGTPLVLDYAEDGVTVDLSSLSETKDNYIYVKAGADFAAFKIAATTKVKAKINKETGDLTVKTAKEIKVSGNSISKDKELKCVDDDSAASGDAFYCVYGRGVDTSGNASGCFDMGATLQVCMASIPCDKDVKGPKDSAQYYKEVGTFSGPFAKVKVAKRPNAPKVAIDYVKGTVTFPKNVIYRVNLGDKASYDATPIGSKTVFGVTSGNASGNSAVNTSSKTIVVDPTQDYSINLKAKAVSGKKPESRQAEIVIPKGVKASGEAVSVSANASADADAKIDNGALTCKFSKDSKKITIAVSSSSKYDYQYCIGSSAPTSTTKWSTVKIGKSATTKAMSAGSNVYVRCAGSKTEMTFPSNVLEAMKVTA